MMTPEMIEEYKAKMRVYYETTLAAWEALDEKRCMMPGNYSEDQVTIIEVSLTQNAKILANFDEFIDDIINDQVAISLFQAATVDLMHKMDNYGK